MKEFSLIADYFAPLAAEAGLGLRDDVALLTPPPGKQLVLTQDAMTAGVHFFADDPAGLIAQKLLRVNLSDLAAKGAEPLGYLLSLLLPAATAEEWIKEFAQGLAQDQQEYGICLFGGDTSRIDGPVTLSLTAIGTVEAGKMRYRQGAQPGDDLYVTGTVGDAALGLQVQQGKLPPDEFLRQRYLLPQPRLGVMAVLPVKAAMDISDGLVQDAEHLASASAVSLEIEVERVPLSPSARKLWQQSPELMEVLLSGGDDFELLFTAPAAHRQELATHPLLTRIGTAREGQGVMLRGGNGEVITLSRKGWQHF